MTVKYPALPDPGSVLAFYNAQGVRLCVPAPFTALVIGADGRTYLENPHAPEVPRIEVPAHIMAFTSTDEEYAAFAEVLRAQGGSGLQYPLPPSP